MLASNDRAPAQAREALSHLATLLPKETFETLLLLVTELVTNSVRHGGLKNGQPIRLDVSRSPSGIRAEVRDHGKGFSPRLPPFWNERGGMGLFLIDRLASRWEVSGDGETAVWFELEA